MLAAISKRTTWTHCWANMKSREQLLYISKCRCCARRVFVCSVINLSVKTISSTKICTCCRRPTASIRSTSTVSVKTLSRWCKIQSQSNVPGAISRLLISNASSSYQRTIRKSLIKASWWVSSRKIQIWLVASAVIWWKWFQVRCRWARKMIRVSPSQWRRLSTWPCIGLDAMLAVRISVQNAMQSRIILEERANSRLQGHVDSAVTNWSNLHQVWSQPSEMCAESQTVSLLCKNLAINSFRAAILVGAWQARPSACHVLNQSALKRWIRRRDQMSRSMISVQFVTQQQSVKSLAFN